MPAISPKDRIPKRLALIGVLFEESLDHLQYGVITFVERDSARLQEVINTVLPTDAEMETALEAQSGSNIEALFHESMVWLKWLMFGCDPVDMLRRLALMNAGKRGVCGSVWGHKDIAYSCRTCMNDPTCAFCVTCFQNSDHKDHDYSMIYTGGGCCDCGDLTACKRSGFCSKHEGAEHIQSLHEDIAKTLGPVLGYLLHHWKNKLNFAESNHQNRPSVDHNVKKSKKVADVLTSAVVGMLLEFCECGDSLLSFVSERLCSEVDLLDVLVRAEMLLSTEVVRNLQELLLKLLSDSFFKLEFAKAFLKYYPTVVNEAVKECGDTVYKKRRLLPTFSVQIFTVRSLFKEIDPLTMLLKCLTNIFVSCSQEDLLQVLKWRNLYETTHRVVEDIKFVMTHTTMPSSTWMKLLAFVQGFSPQKRESGNHIQQEDYDNMHLPFVLACSIANIHALSVARASSTEDELVPITIKEHLGAIWLKLDNTDNNTSGGHPTLNLLTSRTSNASGFGDRMVDGDYTNRLEALSLADWPEIDYDVSSQEISVHIPLHRCLSLVLQRALKRCYGKSESSADSSIEFRNLFGGVLGDCHPHSFSAFVMEHPLRIRVFCSQVRAGMWKKNGDVAVLSYECYRSVRWSELDIELDLFLLQFCAALAPSDLYIARIIERFGLSPYLFLDLEGANEHEAFLVAEMLNLIIQIVKERRFCGLTTAQCLQRELIYKLSTATGDITHSQLVKSLTHDLSKLDQFQQILDTLAEYSPPSEMIEGTYKLRLEYWKELDLYHPRLSLGDFEVMEERYLRFRNVSALTDRLPKWSKTYPFLDGLAKVATCKTVLHIIRVVLFYALSTDKLTASRAPVGVVIKALHLLSLALDISQDQIQCGQADNSIPLLAFAGEEISMGLNGVSDSHSLLSLLVSLLTVNQKENVGGLVGSGGFDLSSLVKNLLQKFEQLGSGCSDKLKVLAPEGVNQFSHSTPSGDANNSAFMSDSDKWKAEKAREKRAELMEKIREAQLKFMESAESDLNDAEESSSDVANDSDQHEQEICSLCHDKNSKSPVSFLVFLQKSRVVTLLDKCPPSLGKEVQRSGKGRVSYSDEGFGLLDCSGVCVSSCGHAVHQKCFDAYLMSLKKRFTRIDPEDEEVQVVDLGGEFLCPACRGLANSVLPDLPREGTRVNVQVKSQLLCSPAANEAFLLKQSLSLLQAVANGSGRNEFLESSLVQDNRGTGTNLESAIGLLREMYFPGYDKFSRSNQLSNSMIMLDTLKCSLVSAEIAARSESTSLVTHSGDRSSYEELRSSGGLILSLLLKIVQVQNSQDGHLRLMCIKKFAKSICCVDAPNGSSSDPCSVEENKASMLEDMGNPLPGIQLLAMASHPVLAYDVFSTLMWILFCLPDTFMSSEKAFFPLVHMCYVISITQAAITCFGIYESVTGLSRQDSLVGDIFEFVGEHRFLSQYFVSNYAEDSGDINETIRNLSFPFLRRCAVLWKLMSSLTSTAFSGIEIDKLEKMFKIPTLDNIVNDEESRSLVKKWLQHIAVEFEVNIPSRVLHITPVVPYKLIPLPCLYQDLLQSYIKQKCVDCGAVPDDSALCLLCGKLCSISWGKCCRNSESQSHAEFCGAGTGVFLWIRETTILLQISAYRAYLPSPYLDKFGEEDHGMVRGNPLYLNAERYEALSQWWRLMDMVGVQKCGIKYIN